MSEREGIFSSVTLLGNVTVRIHVYICVGARLKSLMGICQEIRVISA